MMWGVLLVFWSLSPNNFNGTNSNVFNVNSSGNLNNNNVNNTGAVAPSYLLRLGHLMPPRVAGKISCDERKHPNGNLTKIGNKSISRRTKRVLEYIWSTPHCVLVTKWDFWLHFLCKNARMSSKSCKKIVFWRNVCYN